MKRPLLIAITGNIASGKSTFVNYLTEKGFEVISTDKLGHFVLKNKFTIKSLVEEFGNSILDSKKEIDRKKLGEFVFGNSDNLTKLNRIVQPEIRNLMQKIVDDSKNEILFYEIPLLFESGLERCFDFIITISISKKKQIVRLKKRNNLSEKQIEDRINSQMSNEEKSAGADYIIENNSKVENLKEKTELFLISLKKINFREILKFTDL